MLHPSQFLLQRNISYIFCTIITPPTPIHREPKSCPPRRDLVLWSCFSSIKIKRAKARSIPI